MTGTTFRVVLDANVLFPFTLRDTLLRAAHAILIVTLNLSDFQLLPDGVSASGPDDFLLDLFDFDPEGIVALLCAQAAALRNPRVRGAARWARQVGRGS